MHIPVLLKESIEFLKVKEVQGNFIDCTFGEGGHSLEIIKHSGSGSKILAFEWDEDLYKKGRELIQEKKLMKKIKLVNENFAKIKKVVKKEKFMNIKGVIFDLGISSYHYDESGRGFSFKKDEFLDMRINKKLKITAFEVINYYSQKDIIDILKKYGEEYGAEKIAKEIVKRRRVKKIETAKELARIISIVKKGKRKIHPATKSFLALRSYVNNELENLRQGLEGALDVLDDGGRIVIITFHGLEDKIVKDFIKKHKREINIVTKSVVRPTQEEIKTNPRSRSAKLRAVEKLSSKIKNENH